jgi:hypothetical protein
MRQGATSDEAFGSLSRSGQDEPLGLQTASQLKGIERAEAQLIDAAVKKRK